MTRTIGRACGPHQGGVVTLSFSTRRAGDVMVIQCSGNIIEGDESVALQRCVSDLVREEPCIVLHLGDVQFIDSSGLGLLVRLVTRAQHARASLKLCAASPRIREVVRATRLNTVLALHESEEDALAAFHRPARTAQVSAFSAKVLCVDPSADVLAYVRELMKQAGFAVVSATNLPDALTLLKATRPQVVVIGAALRGVRHTHAGSTFNTLVDQLAVVELPPQFSTNDAGEAGRELLDHVRAALGDASPSADSRGHAV